MSIALIAGILGGGFVGLALSQRIVQRIATSSRRDLVYRASIISTAAIAIPAFFLAVVIGGNFGGAAGGSVLTPWGIDEELGIAIGLATGLGVVLAAALLLGATAGALLGRVLAGSRRGP